LGDFPLKLAIAFFGQCFENLNNRQKKLGGCFPQLKLFINFSKISVEQNMDRAFLEVEVIFQNALRYPCRYKHLQCWVHIQKPVVSYDPGKFSVTSSVGLPNFNLNRFILQF
jgi:hypothetical protein